MFLDTNYLIGNGKAGSPAAQQIDVWLAQGQPLRISAMAWAEFLCGPITAAEIAQCRAILHEIRPLDDATAALGASLFNATGRRSRSLPDCLIAATAIILQEPLATLNFDDFKLMAPFGLQIFTP